MPRELTDAEVEQTKGDYVRCAVLAKRAGYDGVEGAASTDAAHVCRPSSSGGGEDCGRGVDVDGFPQRCKQA